MTNTRNDDFAIGPYRPIYLWAGPGTIRMNRVKFMDQPVDVEAHLEAHEEIGARRVVQDMACNWIHLTYNWGFPPEVEVEDWEAFGHAAEVYHGLGAKVFAYFQSSNCVYRGSYREKDWYARDPRGRKIYYYSERYMACLTHPEWEAHLKERIADAIARGADGIFFDNMWHGAMPWSLGGAWLGPAGCHCERCKTRYREDCGAEIPARIDPRDEAAGRYLRWRADQVTDLIRRLSAHARSLKPGIPIAANDFDIYMRNAYLIYGLDLPGLAAVQDVTMIEDFALCKWQPEAGRLTNNVLTIKNGLAQVRDQAHLSVLAYDTGIGFDEAYATRRYPQSIYEAAAGGASLTTKGTEYTIGGQHTMLTTADQAETHRAIGEAYRWLADHADLYVGGRNAARVGLLFPDERLWLDWHELAGLYYGAGQALLLAGIPWRVVTADDDLSDLDVLLTFDQPHPPLPEGARAVDVCGLAGWALPGQARLDDQPLRRAILEGVVDSAVRLYMGSRTARRLLDSLGAIKVFSQAAFFDAPEAAAQQSLIEALGKIGGPRVTADAPVFLDVWERVGRTQIHAVNYADRPQTVTVDFGEVVRGSMVSPGWADVRRFEGTQVEIDLDLYVVLLLD